MAQNRVLLEILVNRLTKLCVTPKAGNVCITNAICSLLIWVSCHAAGYLIRQYCYNYITVLCLYYSHKGTAYHRPQGWLCNAEVTTVNFGYPWTGDTTIYPLLCACLINTDGRLNRDIDLIKYLFCCKCYPVRCVWWRQSTEAPREIWTMTFPFPVYEHLNVCWWEWVANGCVECRHYFWKQRNMICVRIINVELP
jgi:hypothetical protein